MRPYHIGFICRGSSEWSLQKKKKLYEGYRKSFSRILELMELQVKRSIPVTTFHLMPTTVDDSENYAMLVDEIAAFLSDLSTNELLHRHKIKISVIGKWYNLPTRAIEAIKKIIEDTKDYDNYFVNFCINYDGQEEIVDAAKMVARRVKLGKIDVDAITKDIVKDDLYSSYFVPPNVIIVTGNKCSLGGFLLWDSVDAEIVFLNKNFPEITTKDVEKSLKTNKG